MEEYQPKIPLELIDTVLKSVGLQTPDERVHKLISAAIEIQLLKIIDEVKGVNISNQKEASVKSHLSLEDL